MECHKGLNISDFAKQIDKWIYNNSLGFEAGSCPSAWFGGGQQPGQVYGFLLVANFSRDRSLLYNFLNESAVINVTSAGIIVAISGCQE